MYRLLTILLISSASLPAATMVIHQTGGTTLELNTTGIDSITFRPNTINITATLTASKTVVSIGETITLTASTNALNPTFYWKDGGDPTDLINGWAQGSSTHNFAKGSAGTYTFHLMVWTVTGSKVVSSTITVTGNSNTTIHTNIIASTFWVGEGASGANGGISNVGSAWDSQWGVHFGLSDAPTIARDADFIPTSPEYKGTENPYYFALPYNDYDPVAYDGADCNAYVSAAGRSDLSVIYDADYERNIVVTSSIVSLGYDKIKSSTSRIPWINSENWSGKSRVKGRWIKITKNGKDCYAQWGDAGPYYYDDYDYVFGSASPMNQKVAKDAPNAGIDLSPSVMKYLGISIGDQGTTESGFSWQFVDFAQVPDGPWKKHISTNQLTW